MNKLEVYLPINLGIDLDGVAANFVGGFSNWLKSRLNIAYDDADIKDYYWYNCIPSLTKELFWSEFNKFSEDGGYEKLDLMPGAQESIIRLLRNTRNVLFITGRQRDTRNQTINFMEKYFGQYLPDTEWLIHSNDSDHKSKAVLENNIDVFIDDAPHYALSVANNTKADVYLMDQTYNRQVEHDKITRVQNWEDFLNRLETKYAR